ncbi:MAG: trypsin-like serine protease [Ruminococcaceae bacterium]|nr:trypsin-like serine protease [Oscillospiraceae bacterium]
MNQENPMNEKKPNQDTYEEFDSDSTRSRRTQNPENGQEYTNPDGSHGYIYNSSASCEHRNRAVKSAVIACSTVVATLVLGACCFFGAYTAVQSLNHLNKNSSSAEEGNSNRPNSGISGELVIRDDTQQSGSNHKQEPWGDNAVGGSDPSDTSWIPNNVSIDKKPPLRQDSNGDGRAEIETDASGEVLTSAGQGAVSVATVVNRVAASVVEISTKTTVQSGQTEQTVSGGAGSGVIISKEGFIVTNHHVIEGARAITVRLNNGREFPATLVGADEQTDIAVLWIDAGTYPLTVATLGASFDLVTGEDILAIGNPLGALGGTVTEGMISATARDISINGIVMTLLQVSAPINPGNSGGGLFNMAGDLVGIVNAKMTSEEVEGLGFAIPVDIAYPVILELIAHGYVRGRPTVDFSVVEVTSVQTAMRYFDSLNLGVYVYTESHPILQYGDLILAADGMEISTANQLQALIQRKQVGDSLELTVYRAREQITVTVTIVEAVPTSLQPAA